MFNFKPQTVDGVLAVFQTAIDNLKTVAQSHQQEAAAQENIVILAQAAKEAAEREAARATSIAAQMQSVFN